MCFYGLWSGLTSHLNRKSVDQPARSSRESNCELVGSVRPARAEFPISHKSGLPPRTPGHRCGWRIQRVSIFNELCKWRYPAEEESKCDITITVLKEIIMRWNFFTMLKVYKLFQSFMWMQLFFTNWTFQVINHCWQDIWYINISIWCTEMLTAIGTCCWGNPGRFAPDPVRPLDVSPQRRFAPGRFAPGRFAPLVVSPLVDSPQEEISTYFVEIYVNSKCKYICNVLRQ